MGVAARTGGGPRLRGLRQASGEGRRATRLAGKGLAAVGAAGMGGGGGGGGRRGGSRGCGK